MMIRTKTDLKARSFAVFESSLFSPQSEKADTELCLLHKCGHQRHFTTIRHSLIIHPKTRFPGKIFNKKSITGVTRDQKKIKPIFKGQKKTNIVCGIFVPLLQRNI